MCGPDLSVLRSGIGVRCLEYGVSHRAGSHGDTRYCNRGASALCIANLLALEDYRKGLFALMGPDRSRRHAQYWSML